MTSMRATSLSIRTNIDHLLSSLCFCSRSSGVTSRLFEARWSEAPEGPKIFAYEKKIPEWQWVRSAGERTLRIYPPPGVSSQIKVGFLYLIPTFCV
jgi:hypothetical protein